jgi:hypothetical protein
VDAGPPRANLRHGSALVGVASDHLSSQVHRKARDRALAELTREKPAYYSLLLEAHHADPAHADLPAKTRADRVRMAARADLKALYPMRYEELYDQHVPAIHLEQGTVEGERSRLARWRRARRRARATPSQA